MNDSVDSIEMPKYKFYKEVHALKIKLVSLTDDGSGLITPDDERFAEFKVNKSFMDDQNPAIGGYYVVYGGGYKSFSSADVFERSYEIL